MAAAKTKLHQAGRPGRSTRRITLEGVEKVWRTAGLLGSSMVRCLGSLQQLLLLHAGHGTGSCVTLKGSSYAWGKPLDSSVAYIWRFPNGDAKIPMFMSVQLIRR